MAHVKVLDAVRAKHSMLRVPYVGALHDAQALVAVHAFTNTAHDPKAAVGPTLNRHIVHLKNDWGAKDKFDASAVVRKFRGE